MEVILLEKMSLGSLGAKVHVKSGYARNYLIPMKKAVYATPKNLARFEKIRKAYEQREEEKLQEALKTKAACEVLGILAIEKKAGEEGKLFGSISTQHIAEALAEHNIVVDKHTISLPLGGLRVLGEHDVTITLGSGITLTLKVNVVPENDNQH